MKTEQALSLYLAYLEQRHYAQDTLLFKSKALDYFVTWMDRSQIKDWREVKLNDIRAYQAYLAKKKKPNGEVNSIGYHNMLLWTVKDFYRFLYLRHKILVDPCADLPPLRKPKRLPRGVITAAQVNRLLSVINLKRAYGFRDRAIFELLYSSGLRGGEVCRLSIYDIDFNKKLVRVVQGKGRKDRLIPVGKTALNYVQEYLKKVRPLHLARSRQRQNLDHLFLTVKGTPFNMDYLYQQIKHYRKIAGLPDAVSTHSLRHACATEMLRGGASVRHVQEMLGHAHMSTTQVYTHILPYDLKRVHAKTAPSEHRRVIEVPAFQKKAWRDRKNSGHYR